MRFTIRQGSGRAFSVTWDDGLLSGDVWALRRLVQEAMAYEGEPVGPPTGPFTEADHLASPLSTVFVAREAFGADILVEGEVPEPPAIPEGAVA